MDFKFLRVTLLVSFLFMVTIFFVVLYTNGVGPGQKEEIVEKKIVSPYTTSTKKSNPKLVLALLIALGVLFVLIIFSAFS